MGDKVSREFVRGLTYGCHHRGPGGWLDPRNTRNRPGVAVNENTKCSIIRWLNSKVTFQDLANMAKVAGIEVRSLVVLHPSFHVSEQLERVGS